jgi:nucleoside-diphosphate-sugar epimerase
MSSIGVYDVKDNRNISEATPLAPRDEYSYIKLLADNMIIKKLAEHNIHYTILRPSNVVGVDMANKSFQYLLTAIKKKKFFFIKTKDTISNYVHVGDVVDSLILCINNKKAKNQIFNLSYDCKLSEIVSRVQSEYNISGPYLCIPEKPLRILIWIINKFINFPLTDLRINALTSINNYSCKKIKDTLGFYPSHSIPDFAIKYLRASDD